MKIMKNTCKIIMVTQLLVFTMISKGTSMEEIVNKESPTLSTTSEEKNQSQKNTPVDLDYFMGEPLPSYIGDFYNAFYNPNNPEYRPTGEKDEQGRQVYIEYINEKETGDRYVEEVDQDGRLLTLTKISK